MKSIMFYCLQISFSIPFIEGLDALNENVTITKSFINEVVWGILRPNLQCGGGGSLYLHRDILRTPVDIQEFSSVLTLSTERQNQVPQVKDSLPQDSAPLQTLTANPGVCASDQPSTNQWFQQKALLQDSSFN